MKAILIGAGCIAALLTAPAWAQDPNQARSLAATCFTCHGSDGRSVGGVPPGLAGQDKGELLRAMMEFKSGKRGATVMHQQAKGYTDAQIEAIAGYFSAMKPGTAAPAPAARGGY